MWPTWIKSFLCISWYHNIIQKSLWVCIAHNIHSRSNPVSTLWLLLHKHVVEMSDKNISSFNLINSHIPSFLLPMYSILWKPYPILYLVLKPFQLLGVQEFLHWSIIGVFLKPSIGIKFICMCKSESIVPIIGMIFPFLEHSLFKYKCTRALWLWFSVILLYV